MGATCPRLPRKTMVFACPSPCPSPCPEVAKTCSQVVKKLDESERTNLKIGLYSTVTYPTHGNPGSGNHACRRRKWGTENPCRLVPPYSHRSSPYPGAGR